ncbi:MAG: hypothetical protein MR606_00195 [Mollicutes bacterium]|nr:hypothetical protein [Mollicutes bacterium]MDD7263935.1 hypothetical protein [bacterium]
MGNKLAFILSIYMILMTFLLGTDIVLIQTSYSNLDSLSQIISYQISNYGIDEYGNIDEGLIKFAKEQGNANLTRGETSERTYIEGDLYPYFLTKEYKAILLSSSPIKISIKRYAVIGINHT